MKILHLIAYIYHRLIRRFHRRKGSWQNRTFEYHHKKARYYKEKL